MRAVGGVGCPWASARGLWASPTTSQKPDRQAAHLRERSIATWVAHNQMTEVELAPPWPATGGRNGEVEMAGVKWRWRLDVKSTDDPDLRRLDMTVYPPGSEDESPDAPTSARLSGFLSKEGR